MAYFWPLEDFSQSLYMCFSFLHTIRMSPLSFALLTIISSCMTAKKSNIHDEHSGFFSCASLKYCRAGQHIVDNAFEVS